MRRQEQKELRKPQILSKEWEHLISQQIREGKAPNEGQDFSYSEQRQKLMTAEQSAGMELGDLLQLVGNRNPLKANRVRDTTDKEITSLHSARKNRDRAFVLLHTKFRVITH